MPAPGPTPSGRGPPMGRPPVGAVRVGCIGRRCPGTNGARGPPGPPCHRNLDLADVAAGISAVRERAIRHQDAALPMVTLTMLTATPDVAARYTRDAARSAERSRDALRGKSACSARVPAALEQLVFLPLPGPAVSLRLVLPQQVARVLQLWGQQAAQLCELRPLG